MSERMVSTRCTASVIWCGGVTAVDHESDRVVSTRCTASVIFSVLYGGVTGDEHLLTWILVRVCCHVDYTLVMTQAY